MRVGERHHATVAAPIPPLVRKQAEQAVLGFLQSTHQPGIPVLLVGPAALQVDENQLRLSQLKVVQSLTPKCNLISLPSGCLTLKVYGADGKIVRPWEGIFGNRA